MNLADKDVKTATIHKLHMLHEVEENMSMMRKKRKKRPKQKFKKEKHNFWGKKKRMNGMNSIFKTKEHISVK